MFALKLGQMLHSHFTWIFNNNGKQAFVVVVVGVDGAEGISNSSSPSHPIHVADDSRVGSEKVFTIMLEIRALLFPSFRH